MDNVLKIPADVQQLPPFRLLMAQLKDEAKVLQVWFLLWRELYYRAQEGGTPGRFHRGELDQVISAAAEATGEAMLGRLLEECRLITVDGDEYVCSRFMALHGGVSPSARSMAQRGGDMRNFSLRQKNIGEKAFQQSLAISANKFVDEEGKPLDAEQTKRVTRLIIACDNALFKPERPPFAYTEGLIQSALQVLKKFTDEEIDRVCREVALRREHPALGGMTAERMLPVFEEMVGRLA